ncbi:MAG: hypothetical protein FVQ82_05795 [Planctomycetes bacterium]|nr:hypothetical protein [Planctomycetota bacterium]
MKTSLLIALVLTILIGGCAITGSGSAFDSDGIPKQQYYVGGGFSVEYSTQETGGTIIFADKVSKKTLMTKTMTPNETFEFSQSPTSADFATGLKNVGIDPANMKLSLYFIPHKKTAVDKAK